MKLAAITESHRQEATLRLAYECAVLMADDPTLSEGLGGALKNAGDGVRKAANSKYGQAVGKGAKAVGKLGLQAAKGAGKGLKAMGKAFLQSLRAADKRYGGNYGGWGQQHAGHRSIDSVFMELLSEIERLPAERRLSALQRLSQQLKLKADAAAAASGSHV